MDDGTNLLELGKIIGGGTAGAGGIGFAIYQLVRIFKKDRQDDNAVQRTEKIYDILQKELTSCLDGKKELVARADKLNEEKNTLVREIAEKNGTIIALQKELEVEKEKKTPKND